MKPQALADVREVVGAHVNPSGTASTWPPLVRDEAISCSLADYLFGDLQVDSELRNRPPRLTARFKRGELCEWMSGLHTRHVEHVDMLTNELVDVRHLEKPPGRRTPTGPATASEQAWVHPPAQNRSVVESENPLEGTQAESVHPA